MILVEKYRNIWVKNMTSSINDNLLNANKNLGINSTNSTFTDFLSRLGSNNLSTLNLGINTASSSNITSNNVLASDLAGNTTTAARDIGAITGTTQTFRDSVSSTDTNDFYRLTINPNSSLSIQLTGLSADADLQLLDANGSSVALSTNGGNNSDVINVGADIIRQRGATYFVRVFQFSGNTNYNLSVSGSLPDFAGNTTATARNVGPLNGSRVIQDFVGADDTNDYYRFNIGPSSNFSLRLDGLTADADVQILNSAGTVIGSSTAASNNAEQINLSNLAPGSYFARVYQFSGATNYNLSLSASRTDLAGNTQASGRNLGILNGSATVSEFVNSADANDFYRFSLSGTSNFSLALNGLTADADVQLLNNSGQVIASSILAAANAESITRNLAAGNYAVRVYSVGTASTNYNLNLSSSLTTTVDTAGNTTTTARNIGNLSGDRFTFRDAVSSVDRNDFYRLSINPTSSLNVQLNGLTADADVEVLDSNGRVVAASRLGGTNAESINISADTIRQNGTDYFVRVYQFNGNTNYNLSVSGSAPDFASNTTATARDLGPLNGTATIQDAVNSGDANDYYRFSIGPNSNFNLSLNGLTSDADVQILNSAGVVVASSTLAGNAAEQINLSNLAPGSYFARVFSFNSSNTNYNLSLSATQADFAGNTLAGARNLGVLNGSRSISDVVTSLDTNDYYRFQLNGTSNFNLSLSALTADADVQILNSAGTVITSSQLSGTSAESISRSLAAGTYFVRVFPFNGANTSYNLSLAA
jgi:Bacterial pre-peptidase C-terminal domain